MKLKGYIYLAVTILLFSTFEVVSGTLRGLINPMQLTFIRFFIGGTTLLPWVIIKKDKISRKDILFFAMLGMLNIFISMGSLQLSIWLGKASTAAILISSNPIFVLIFSSIILKENISANKVMCILFGIIGILLIIYGGNSGGDTAYGILFGIIASATFGLYTVLGKLKPAHISSITMISLSSILGSLIYIPILIYNKLPIFYVHSHNIMRVLYLGIFVSGIAYITFIEALAILSASSGSMVFFLKPVIASILAVIFLSETIKLNAVLGTLLVLLGMLINFTGLNFLKIGKRDIS